MKNKKNACIIAYTFYEMDYRVRRYAEALAGQGYKVDVIALRGEKDPEEDSLNGVRIYKIQKRNYKEKNSYKFLLNHLRFFFKGGWLLSVKHLRNRYQFIHVHNIPDFLIFMGIIPKLTGAKLILDVHDIVPEYFSQKFNKSLDSLIARLLLLTEKASTRFADHVIVANDIWREKIIKRDFLKSERCTTILNYPLLDFYKARRERKSGGDFRLIYPGTISDQHGLDVAIKAIALAKNKIPDIRLDIFALGGSLFLTNSLKSLVKNLDLEKNVSFLKPVNPELLGKFISEADVGIVPKKSGLFSDEAFSTKILDFMAAGIPVLASRTRIDEYYFDDTQIKFFEVEDPDDMARAICELYEKPKLRESLSDNGRQFIAKNNWEVKKSLYDDILKTLSGNSIEPTNFVKVERSDVEVIDPLKNEKWDQWVEKHPFGLIYHLSGWKNVLDKSFGHIKGHYLAILDERGDIRSALPLFEAKSFLTGNRLVSIPFTSLFDPLVSSREDMDKLVEAALELSKKVKASYIELRTFMSSGLKEEKKLDEQRFYKYHYIPLGDDPEAIKKTFDRTCVRQRISRALKSDLTLVNGETENDLRKFYNLHMITRKRNGLPVQSYLFFKTLWNNFYPSGKLQLFLAEHKGNPVAGMILLKYKERVSAEFAASDDQYRNMSPNHFLFWESIKMACREGYKIFDFGRTSPSNTGLMDFKERWGTQIVDLPYFYHSEKMMHKNGDRETSFIYRLTSKICRNTPEFALPYVGRFIYRHLG